MQDKYFRISAVVLELRMLIFFDLKKKESTKVPFDYRVEGQYFHADLPWTQNCVTSDVETELGLGYSLLLVPAYDNTE